MVCTGGAGVGTILCLAFGLFSILGIVGVASQSSTKRTPTAAAQQCPGNPEGKKIICHMQNWSVFRPGKGKFTPEKIDPFLCTHIIYLYAHLNSATFLIEFSDPYADISLNTVLTLTNLKNQNPNLKVLIGIGGWDESASPKYSQLIADPAKRARFNLDVIDFLRRNKFDGLELFWQFPGFPQGKRNNTTPNTVSEDRKNFALWVAELKQVFGCSMLLSSMVPPDQEKSFEAYDPSIYQHLDWITILSYDYHGIWHDYTGYAGPLYSDQNVLVTVDVSVNYYIRYGVPLEKIIMGVASYGQSFTLDDPAMHGIGAPARFPGTRGPFTNESGLLAFNEIFDQNLDTDKEQRWTVVRNERLGTYAYRGDQWVTFDDPDMCRRKAEYIARSNLGGISFSNIDMDTFQIPIGSESEYGPFDLIRSARDVLTSNMTKRSIEETDSRNETNVLGMIGVTSQASRTQSAMAEQCPGNPGGKKIICHMQNSAVYRPGRGEFTAENIDPFLCTHIIYVYANLNATTFLIEFSDPHADISLNTVLTLTNIKNHNPNLKILIGIGGWDESASPKYSQLVADPAKRSRFNRHVIDFLSRNKFDGLELFWQFPGFPQGSRNLIPNAVNEDRKNFALWVSELKQVFGCSMLLSSVVPPDLEKSADAYDPSIYQHLDWITILSYDYHGIWLDYTGYAAPLYSNQIVLMSVDVSVNFYIRYGVPLEKIIMGVASYGQSFTLDDPAMHGIGAPARRPGTPGSFTRQAGFLAFNEIFDQNLGTAKERWTVVRNERLGTYAYRGDQWVTFDDPDMCRRKAEYVNRSNLGGISFTNIDMDTFQSPTGSRSKYGPFDLIRSARDVLISNVTVESIQDSGSPMSTKHLLIIVPLSVITTLLCLGIVAGVVIYRRKIKTLELKLRELTKTEIDEFHNGNPNVNQHDINAPIHAAPFDKKYELAEGHLIVERDKLLGSGQFGLVFRGNVLQSGGVEYANETMLVAVKTVKPDVDVEYFKALLSELKIMAYLGQHENVASLVGAQTDKIGNREIFVAIEFCAKGDLKRALKNGRANFHNVFRTDPVFTAGEGDTDLDYHGNKKDNNSIPLLTKTVKSKTKYDAVSMKSDSNYVNNVDEKIITTMNLIEWARQISNGMAYLSSKKVIHGDLAARNILLTADNVAKISDFGLSRQLLNYSNYMKKTVLPLPWRWMAIESLRNMDFSVQSDVWGFGVTLWEIFSLGELPYPNLKWDQEFVDKLSQGKLRLQPPEYGNSKIYELMLACWKKEPSERIYFETILIQLNQLLVALTSNVNADTNVEYISLFENNANP